MKLPGKHAIIRSILKMFASTVFFYNILLLMFLKFVEDNHMYDPAIMFYTKYQLSQVLIYLIPLVISISIYIFFFCRHKRH